MASLMQIRIPTDNGNPVQRGLLLWVLLALALPAQASDAWDPIVSADELTRLMTDTTAERQLTGGEVSRGEYFADGTGILHAWGASIPRTWEVSGQNKVCVTEQRQTRCFGFERNQTQADLYRARDETSGAVTEFRIADRVAAATGADTGAEEAGGVATPSTSEIAAELSNPNTAVATLTFKNQFRWFSGDLPDADKQSSYTLLFQPALPFVLPSKDKIIWRPAVPLLFDQPMPDPDGGFGSGSGIGDIAFDLVYAPKTDNGLIFAAGMVASLPTATNDLGTKKWTLGPELLIGKASRTSVYGILPNHQWDIAGSGKQSISLSTAQLFYTYLPKGGWSVGSSPIIAYDWTNEQWTVPLQLNVGKTIIKGGRPWKLSLELNYYVEKPDAFGPEWMISFNVAPVVKNGLASWFGL